MSAPTQALDAGARSTSRVLLRNFVLLPLSFAGAGLGNVVPQLHLARLVPQDKERLLALCLWGGAAASIAGVLVAQRLVKGHSLHVLAAAVALCLGAVAGMAEIPEAAAFVGAYFALRFALNLLTQLCDRRIVLAGGEADRRLSDAANLAYRFAGMMSGSLFFALFFTAREVTAGTLALLAALSLVSVLSLPNTTPIPESLPLAAVKPTSPPSAAARLVVVAAALAYATLYLFGANLTYLLGDLLHLSEPAKRAGFLLLVVYAFSVLGAALVPAWRRWRPPPTDRLDGGAFLISGATIAGGTLLLVFVEAPGTALLVGVSAALGLAHALFLLETRSFATRAALRGDTALVGAFNNVGNAGALAGFGLMGLLSLVAASRRFHLSLLVLIAALAALSALAGWLAGRIDRRGST